MSIDKQRKTNTFTTKTTLLRWGTVTWVVTWRYVPSPTSALSYLKTTLDRLDPLASTTGQHPRLVPTEGDMSTFALKVEAAIWAIEAGELRSYGELAARAGSSKASLACARVRHNLYEAGRDEDLPLHRVMSSKVCR